MADRAGEPTLRGRLVPPRRPPACLPRAAAVARVRAALRGPLLRVVAGAGWGKTTLLALAVAEEEAPVVWCTCDRRLGRGSLARHLALAFAERVPGVRPEAAAAGRPERRVGELCNQIAAAAPEDVVLVLDDVHELVGTDGEEELALLCADLPPQVHLAVASRVELPAPLGGLRPDAESLDEAALALGAEETAELLAAWRPGAGPDEAAELHRRAEGWVTGVVIAARGEDPGEYLMREVVSRQPDDARAVLQRSAVLDRFTAEMAAAVSGREDAGDMVAELRRRRAFLVPAEGGAGWWRHHRMLRRALRRTLAGRPAAELAELHRRAAAAWSRVGQPEAAARHHLRAGDLAAAVAALEPAARAISGEERSTAVAEWLDAIPAELWSDTSGVVLAQASALFYRADYLGAFAAMEAAVEELLAAGDHDRAAVTLVRLLRAVPLAGGLHERAIAAARRLLPRIGSSAGMLPAARVILALLLAEVCRYEEAEDELAAAQALPAGPQTRLTGLQAQVTRAFAIDHPRGRRTEALRALDAAIPELEAAGPADPLNYLVYARAFRAILLTDVGRFDEALAEADRVRAAAAERGLARLAVPVVAMLRFGALAGLGRWDELEVELARTAPAFRRLGGALRGYRHDVAAAQLAAARGDAPGVEAAVAAAREGLEVHGHPCDAAMALADLALAGSAAGLHALAREQAGAARAQAERARAPWVGVRAAMVAAAAWGPGDEGDAALAAAVAASADPRLTALWTRRERGLAAELLPRALERGLGPREVATRLAAACGGEVLTACAERLSGADPSVRRDLAEAAGRAVAGDAALEVLVRDADPEVRRAARGARGTRRSQPRAAIRLVTLGGFAVHRDGRPVPDSAFGRQKARVLLAVLACARAAVHREALIEELWPSLSVRRGLAALNSTLYALRRTLEPELSAGEASSLVVAEGPTYRLVLGERDAWDAQEFLGRARAALGTAGDPLPLLLEAEAAYAGPLLPEWTFAPWTEPLRTELEEVHRAVLVRAAEELAASGRSAEAISRYRLLLALEPEREGWHRALMRVYAGAGERALALRQFHACRRLLRERLGVEPSRETRDLHAELMREG